MGTVQTTEPDRDPASDNAAFDVHATDPSRLKDPDNFHKEVEKRLKRLVNGWHEDDEMIDEHTRGLK